MISPGLGRARCHPVLRDTHTPGSQAKKVQELDECGQHNASCGSHASTAQVATWCQEVSDVRDGRV